MCLALGLGACTQSGTTSASSPASTTPVATPTNGSTGGAAPSSAPTGAGGTTTPPADDDATGTAAPPLPNPVGTLTKVARAGQPATPNVVAPVTGFSSPAAYGDKVSVAVTKATKQVETGHGPGVMTGREFVTFDVELTNGSPEPIDLNQVVVTTYYGATKQLAPPVYTPSAGTSDFGGTVAAGAKATAVLGFAVPSSELGNVTMVVDFDAKHSSATFTGAVPAS